MIELQNISFFIGGNAILQNVSWQIKPGQHALILGESGSGKTTLLHLLAGLLTPNSGQIIIDGQLLAKLPDSQRDAWRGRNIGMVFQTLHLVEALTMRDNLRLARSMAGLTADDTHIETLLKSLSIAEKAEAYPVQLSVGQAQRVAIARAMVNRPKWILADEPTSALDDRHAKATVELLEAQAAECNATLIIATHDQRIKGRFGHSLMLDDDMKRKAA